MHMGSYCAGAEYATGAQRVAFAIDDFNFGMSPPNPLKCMDLFTLSTVMVYTRKVRHYERKLVEIIDGALSGHSCSSRF